MATLALMLNVIASVCNFNLCGLLLRTLNVLSRQRLTMQGHMARVFGLRYELSWRYMNMMCDHGGTFSTSPCFFTSSMFL